MSSAPKTIHATAVLAGARAVLIRGASGSGKTTLALRLLDMAKAGQLPFARLVADDRVYVEAVAGRLLAHVPLAIAGMIEARGQGILAVPYEPIAVVGWIVDLGEAMAARMPQQSLAEIEGIALPHLAFPPCVDPLPVLLAAIRPGG